MFEYKYIPANGLKALDDYKYKSGEYSWLDLKLNNFWFWCAEQLPRTMAPNLVTLIGTFHLLAIAVLAEIYDSGLEGKSPTWVYLLNAWCLFVYQTMDAVDGKQARRTGSSSPLGQLFDHGCDALGTTFIAIGLCSLMGFGGSWMTIAVLATVQVPFYICQWEENHTHVLRAQVGNFGVTEGQYLSMVLNLVTAFAGVEFWKQSVSDLLGMLGLVSLPVPEFLAGMELREVSIFIGGFFPFLLAMTAVLSVATCGANFFRALILTIPLWLQQGLQVALALVEPGKELFSTHPVPLIVVQGILVSHLANRIIVASVCMLEFPFVHEILFPAPFITGLIFYLNKSGDNTTGYDYELLAGIMLVYGVAIVYQFMHFVYNVTVAITNHLNIRCFSITKRNAN